MIREGYFCVGLTEEDHFGVFCAADAFSDGHEGNGFQEVGFSLGVISEDEVNTVAEVYFCVGNITEIFKGDGLTDQGDSPFLWGEIFEWGNGVVEFRLCEDSVLTMIGFW